MKTVFKYVLSDYSFVNDVMPVDMITDAEPLFVDVQHSTGLCVWARVEIHPGKIARKEKFHILVLGTGQAIPAGNWTYLNTAQVGPLVWHFFWNKP